MVKVFNLLLLLGVLSGIVIKKPTNSGVGAAVARALLKLATITYRSLEKPPTKLANSRSPINVTIDDVRSLFPHALISVCTELRIFHRNCTCEDTLQNLVLVSDHSEDAVAVIAVDSRRKMLVVSYRPTSSKMNWLTNIEFFLRKISQDNASVHQGFYKYHNSIHSLTTKVVLKYLKMESYNDYTLHITGFSLGAAIATLSAPAWDAFLRTNNLTNPMQIYAYSSPRVGNLEFTNQIENLGHPIIRYSSHNDIVTNLPPRFLGYSHAGVEFHELTPVNGKRDMIRCDSSYDEDPVCSFGNDALSVYSHFEPGDNPLPSPPFCLKH